MLVVWDLVESFPGVEENLRRVDEYWRGDILYTAFTVGSNPHGETSMQQYTKVKR